MLSFKFLVQQVKESVDFIFRRGKGREKKDESGRKKLKGQSKKACLGLSVYCPALHLKLMN